MRRLIYRLALVLVILCVLAVFLAPTVDLPETALRAKQIAVVILAGIACTAVVALILLLPVSLSRETIVINTQPASDNASLLCTFLC